MVTLVTIPGIVSSFVLRAWRRHAPTNQKSERWFSVTLQLEEERQFMQPATANGAAINASSVAQWG